jgi:cysteinyl-tRNA synthetase
MKLHNTLTRRTEEFKPADENTVSLYTCGPTVYDYYHIGNLRNAVFNDTLRRALVANGYAVKHVMNITDVGHLVSDADDGEDKLEKGAAREGKTVWEVAKHYTEAFKNDMQAMNVLQPNGYHNDKNHDNYARATDFIEQQIEMVQLLVDKDFAYQTEQAIYFDVTKLPDYGILSGQKLADKEIGARSDVVTDPDKKNPHDFAVWFFAVGHFANHTMQWNTPWGSGFPGWHLECSAIIHATLGDPIDIHTGGIDHIGTHHPNEMAQTEAAFGHQLARYWVHNEFILVDGSKMSKSKQNSFTLKDVTNKGFEPLSLRLLYLQAHYRTELNFSWENLEAAQNRLEGYRSMADLKWQTNKNSASNDKIFETTIKEIQQYLFNDLNTAEALSKLSNLEVTVNKSLISITNKDIFDEFLSRIDNLLGLSLSTREDINEVQKQIIKNRTTARDNQNWEKSDELRDELLKQGISVRDTEHGPIWSKL